MPELLHGIGASAGVATGPAYRMAPVPQLPPPTLVSDMDIEVARAYKALAAVAADLRQRAGRSPRGPQVCAPAASAGPCSAAQPTGSSAGDILRAQAMMAEDKLLHSDVEARIQAGSDAPHAITAALKAHRDVFEAAGGYLAERVFDLDDVRDRAVASCLGQVMPGIPSPGHPFVLVAHDLAPADTADLDPGRVLALVTEVGGPTSHTAILARTLGIPAVVNCPGATDIADGLMVSVNGTAGIVETGVRPPAADTVRPIAAPVLTGPGLTADGHRVELLANVGSMRDLEWLEGAEGIGLLRTELLYLGRREAPGLDEQITLYTNVFGAMAGRKVIVRTLDAGADKPLPFLDQHGEPNPALGMRGLRAARRRPELLRTQLRAIAAAAHATTANVWVMAPMVATVAESSAFAAGCHDAGLSQVGVMVEVPAAAIAARAMLGAVDFLSIGTNDLSQYAFAADRQCGDLADLLDPWQPALLRMIADCAAAGVDTGKPVGVCGEAAADPALAAVLVGLGITSLSMPVRAIPAVRQALAARTLEQCQRLCAAVLAATTLDEAKRLGGGEGGGSVAHA